MELRTRNCETGTGLNVQDLSVLKVNRIFDSHEKTFLSLVSS